MKYKKENLVKLLRFVEEVSRLPGNEWFLEELKNNISQDNNKFSASSCAIEAKINLIREYLAIDINQVIDYTYFEEPCRESLFRDCIEMGRYAKGTPGHKIDFGEFCRYAHLQAEEMINYFFNKVSKNNVQLVDEFIQERVSGYKKTRNPIQIHHISYSYKLSAFKSISQISYSTYSLLWFISEYRNELSHRNSLTLFNDDQDLVAYEKAGFTNNVIDLKKLDKNEKNIYNRGKYVVNKRKQDFNSIYDSIEDLKYKIIDALHKIKELPNSKSTIGNATNVLQELKNRLEDGK